MPSLSDPDRVLRLVLSAQVIDRAGASPSDDLLIRPPGGEFVLVSLATALRLLPLADLRDCLLKDGDQLFAFLGGRLPFGGAAVRLQPDVDGRQRLVLDDAAPHHFDQPARHTAISSQPDVTWHTYDGERWNEQPRASAASMQGH